VRHEADRNAVPWAVLIKGLMRRERVCTRCGSRNVSQSRQPVGPVIRLLRLTTYRCHGCRLRFVG
jgi:hypothetical protein